MADFLGVGEGKGKGQVHYFVAKCKALDEFSAGRASVAAKVANVA
jgi:hypothetical protein